MGCILRANGENFGVDDFLNQTALIPCNVYRKGEPKFPGNKKICKTSGLSINVSDAEFSDLQGQIQEATAFLKICKSEIRALCQYAGVEDVCLDFGIEQRDDAIVQFEYFPPTLITLAGRLGLGLEISFYPSAENRNQILRKIDRKIAQDKKKKVKTIATRKRP